MNGYENNLDAKGTVNCTVVNDREQNGFPRPFSAWQKNDWSHESHFMCLIDHNTQSETLKEGIRPIIRHVHEGQKLNAGIDPMSDSVNQNFLLVKQGFRLNSGT